jgi:uncharacterized protein (TIGR03437 family)
LELAGEEGVRAAADLVVTPAAPVYLSNLFGKPDLRREDGSVVNPGSPVFPGDRILVRLTGQGLVKPAIPAGQAASMDDPSQPALPVTAFTGTKRMEVLSARMSTTEAGVLDVWLTVPDLYEGEHQFSVQIGSLSAASQGLRVAARPGSEP